MDTDYPPKGGVEALAAVAALGLGLPANWPDYAKPYVWSKGDVALARVDLGERVDPSDEWAGMVDAPDYILIDAENDRWTVALYDGANEDDDGSWVTCSTPEEMCVAVRAFAAARRAFTRAA